jgi:SAM-dependent methyltransferase
MTATKDSTQMAPFAPKQMMPRSPGLLEALVGDVTEQVAAHLLTLIPNIPTKSVIHDNACGTGQVSEAIMSNHPNSITINATDVMPMFAQACTGKAAKNGWPLKAAVMDAQKLTFPDSTFTHSFMNMALFSIPDAISTVEHVHRTLQSGGIAFITTWAVESQGHAVKAGHDTTRGGADCVELSWKAIEWMGEGGRREVGPGSRCGQECIGEGQKL